MRFSHLRLPSSLSSVALAAVLAMLPAGEPRAQDDTAAETAPEAQDPVEAVVDGTELRRSDVLESARDLPRAYQDQIEQIYPALVERLIDLTLLSNEARQRDLQEDEAVRERVAEFEAQVMREALLEQYLSEHMTEEAVRARYDRSVAEFQPQEEIRARHILVETEEEAKAIVEELDQGAEFAAIARERSTDTGSGAQGGDLGFFTPEQMVPEFSEAAQALEPGSHSETPVESRFGWHVIKVEEKRQTEPPSFEEARPEIENQLSQELVSQLVAELRADAEIELLTPPPAGPAADPEAGGAGESTPEQGAPESEAAPDQGEDAAPAE